MHAALKRNEPDNEVSHPYHSHSIKPPFANNTIGDSPQKWHDSALRMLWEIANLIRHEIYSMNRKTADIFKMYKALTDAMKRIENLSIF